MATCYKCNGKGTIEKQEGDVMGDIMEGRKTEIVQCPACRGTGKLQFSHFIDDDTEQSVEQSVKPLSGFFLLNSGK